MEEDLLARIRGDAGVTALVGARSHWIKRPKRGETPAITLRKISPGRAYKHAGADGLSNTRIQADCWGDYYDDAKRVARALIAALEPAAVEGDTTFVRAFLDGERDDLDPETLSDGTEISRVSLDFIIWHQPTS